MNEWSCCSKCGQFENEYIYTCFECMEKYIEYNFMDIDKYQTYDVEIKPKSICNTCNKNKLCIIFIGCPTHKRLNITDLRPKNVSPKILHQHVI